MYLNLHAPKSPVHSRSPSALSMKSTYSSKKVAEKKETFPNSEELKALEEKRDAIQAKISQLQVRMTQTKQTMTPKIIDDLVNITEESFEIKRSIKEIMTIFGQNESHLNKLRTHLKSPQLNQAQRLDINRRIQSLLGEVKKSKEIKEKLEGVLIKNQHQQTELKNVLHLATANNEDRFNFMFEFEYKALQAESENISTKIKSLSMMEEKNSKIDKLTKTLNEHKQQIQVMALKIDDLEKSKGRSVAEAYRKVSKESKDFREENPVYNCSTPKNMNKSQALNRTTGGKKKFRTDTQFKFLVNAFPTDRSPNTKEETAKAKSPASCVNQKTRRADPDLIPRKSQEQNKNPSFVSSSRSTVNTCVLDTSASQLSQERGLTASQNSQVCRSTRKSYKNENGKEKTSIAKIDLKGSQKENFNETYQARIPMEKPQLQKQKQEKVLSKEPDSHIQLIENQLRPVYPVPICKRPPDFDDLLSEPSSTRNLFNSNENKGFSTSPFKAYMEDLNTKFEKTSYEHSHKDINESARSQHPDTNKSKVNNDDSYCCYQPGESSLFRDIGLGERITMQNFSPKKNVGDSVNIGEEDDTCLFGSIANKKLLYPDNTNKCEFLRDITNTYPMQQLSNKKPLASDKDNEYHYGNPDPYYRNFQRLQDSERKNPMELVFDD